jgi:hypothetical protein
MVAVLGVDPARLPKAGQPHDDGVVEVQPLPEATFCDPLSRYVPQASAEFDPGEQVLDVTIPQAWLSRDPRGWVSPELWDSGINAGVLGYSISHQRLQGGGVARTATGVVLNAGVNVGAWRLRHDGRRIIARAVPTRSVRSPAGARSWCWVKPARGVTCSKRSVSAVLASVPIRACCRIRSAPSRRSCAVLHRPMRA